MERFTGLLGMAVILGIAYALSTNRKRINYRTVGVGLLIQLVLALFVLRTTIGQQIFEWLGTLVNSLLDFSKQGSNFVFGSLVPLDGTGEFFFAFQVLPAIIFVGSLASIAYYLGIMQFIVKWIARLMVKLMGTSGAESLYAIGTVFVGQSEAPLLVRPYLAKMTRSELNAIMTGGMATIAGSVLFAYVGMLGPEWAPKVIAASIMGAPAGLVLSKILCPEEGKPETMGVIELKDEQKNNSIIEAASNGAIEGMHLAFIVGTMLIAFIALIATVNGILGWCGGAINQVILSLSNQEYIFAWQEYCSIQGILGLILGPLAWCLGAPWADAQIVGSLIGQKLVLNEFVGYSELLKHMSIGGVPAQLQELSDKGKLIATFALCGFANFSSVGINVGCIGGLAPERKSEVASLGMRALLGGAMASMMTACLVGILS